HGLEGRRCHVEARAVPFRMPDGAKVHLCISRDVNERHEAHEAVRRSEERLRLVQEVTGLADFEADARGKAYFSPHFLEQMGLPADSATALAFEDWLGQRSEEHTSELQSRENLVCRLLLETNKPT